MLRQWDGINSNLHALLSFSPSHLDHIIFRHLVVAAVSSPRPSVSALVAALWPEYQLQQFYSRSVQLQWLCGCSVPAPATLSPGKKPSKHSESWRTQVYYAGRLRGDHSPKSEPLREVSQGLYGLVNSGLRAWWTGVRTGKVIDAGVSFTEADVWGRGGQRQLTGLGAVWPDFAQSSRSGCLLLSFLLRHFPLQSLVICLFWEKAL